MENGEKWLKQSGGATSKWRHNGNKFLFRISVENLIMYDSEENSIGKRGKMEHTVISKRISFGDTFFIL